METSITLTVNGQPKTITTDPQRPLLDVLREDLHLTGTRYGCGEGQCRCCTVFLDDQPVYSCLTPVSRAANKSVTTIEGLAEDGKPTPLQEAFLEEGFQCGFCSTGFIMVGTALLRKTPKPTDKQIVDAMSRNICRCCNYEGAKRAIRKASGQSIEDKGLQIVEAGKS
jgi:aerobic-type carbon monoxide dehydrogenase small subunit (CoxS/CutS family)